MYIADMAIYMRDRALIVVALLSETILVLNVEFVLR